jgi:hypothetical protein
VNSTSSLVVSPGRSGLAAGGTHDTLVGSFRVAELEIEESMVPGEGACI